MIYYDEIIWLAEDSQSHESEPVAVIFVLLDQWFSVRCLFCFIIFRVRLAIRLGLLYLKLCLALSSLLLVFHYGTGMFCVHLQSQTNWKWKADSGEGNMM